MTETKRSNDCWAIYQTVGRHSRVLWERRGIKIVSFMCQAWNHAALTMNRVEITLDRHMFLSGAVCD